MIDQVEITDIEVKKGFEEKKGDTNSPAYISSWVFILKGDMLGKAN